MSALSAVMYREGKIRATNALFIFWDVVYPLGYLLVFGVGMNEALGFRAAADRLPRVLPRRRSRDGRLRHRVEHRVVVLHGPRQRHLLRDADLSDQPRGVPARQGAVQRRRSGWCRRSSPSCSRAAVLGVALRPDGFPLLAAAVIVGTAGWFFFYAIFALAIRRNDAFNTVTSIFYFVFLFASSMFYPIDPLPAAFRVVALANPITWHVDVMRYATIGARRSAAIALEAAGFVASSRWLLSRGALVVLRRQG